MLTIPIILKEFPGKGIGLTAAHAIKKGDVIWKRNWDFTKKFTRAEVEKMDKIQQDFINKYTYFIKNNKNIHYFDCDDSRFMNHSSKPNTEYDENYSEGHATRDIAEGEEITCDYNKLGGVDFTDVEGVKSTGI